MAMTEQELYLFDLQGYLVMPNALTDEQVDALNRILDEHIAEETEPGMQTHRFRDLLDWGKAYRHLLDNPRVLPHLEGLVGEQFRLDHVYLDVIRSGKGPIGTRLHGGRTPFRASVDFRFEDGRMHNALTVVAYNLKDVGPNDGALDVYRARTRATTRSQKSGSRWRSRIHCSARYRPSGHGSHLHRGPDSWHPRVDRQGRKAHHLLQIQPRCDGLVVKVLRSRCL